MNISNLLKKKLDEHRDAIEALNAAELLRIPQISLDRRHVVPTDLVHEGDVLLICFHYRSDLLEQIQREYPQDEYLSICQVRGVIIDLNTKKVVCKSYPCTSNILIESVPTTDVFNIEDYVQNPNSYLRDMFRSEKIYNKYIVGAVIRFFSVDGFQFAATHKKIKFDNSKFGSDKTFNELFFGAQDCFRNELELDVPPGIVHTFIFSSNTINTDSRQRIDRDLVYYITSFRIVDNNALIDHELEVEFSERIRTLNHRCSKPIQFPVILTPEEVNQVLNPLRIQPRATIHGMTVTEISDDTRKKDENRDETELMSRYFQNGEKVAVRTRDYGIHSLTPPSSMRRTLFNDGKLNIEKIMCDCIGFYIEGSLSSNKIFIDYGFPFEILLELKERVKNGETIDFSQLGKFRCTFFEKLITNLFFSVPLNKIDSVFEAVNNYDIEARNAINFLLLKQEELKDALFSKNIQEYLKCISKKKTLIDYFKFEFGACFNSKNKNRKTIDDVLEMRTGNWWPGDLRAKFEKNKQIYENKNRKQFSSNKQNGRPSPMELKIENAIMCFVLNAPGIIHYSLLKLKETFTKYEDYMSKREIKMNEETKEEA